MKKHDLHRRRGQYARRKGSGSFSQDLFRGPKRIASDDLQLAILWFLNEADAHGYELISRFEDLTNGYYSPSPGAIYPALTLLAELGHASFEKEGKRKCYCITAQGKKHLGECAEQAERTISSLGDYGRRVHHADSTLNSLADDDAELKPFLALRKLKRLLKTKQHCDQDELDRIVQVLESAYDKISEGHGL